MTPCKVTVFTTTKPATLGKTFRLGLNGLEKTVAGQMVEGTYETRAFGDVQQLAALLTSIRTDQALCASLPVDGSSSGKIATKAELPANSGALSRTKDCFALPVGVPGLITLDYDPHGTALFRDELWSVLKAACPAVADCGVVWWCSGSSHIFSGDIEIQGLRGQRLYLVATDGADVARCWRNACRSWAMHGSTFRQAGRCWSVASSMLRCSSRLASISSGAACVIRHLHSGEARR